jgi:hypothetical protein
LADRGTGRSLMRRDLADPDPDLAARDLADPDRDLADPDRDLVARDRDLVDPDRVDPELGRTGRGDRVERGLAARDLVDRDRVDPELGRTGRRDRVERGLAARDLVDRGRAGRGRAGRGRADRDLVVDRDRAGRDLDRGLADRCRGALTIGVMPRSVVPWMRLAASAHTTTARPLRHGQGDSAGTMGLLPVGRRQTGSARHLQVVGTVLRLPVVGTTRGTGRTAA